VRRSRRALRNARRQLRYRETDEEVAKSYIDSLTRRDDASLDTSDIAEMRRSAAVPPPEPTDEKVGEWTPTREEISQTVSEIRTCKAAGLDRIDSRILRRSWSVTDLFINCYRWGVFTVCWKVGLLVVVPKPHTTKPPNDPKAYRPITLLPEMEKLSERLLARRLHAVLGGEGPDRLTPVWLYAGPTLRGSPL
jgi:hypothetical protein